jgi:GAF domain-containing protein/PilZ domain-containing protein
MGFNPWERMRDMVTTVGDVFPERRHCRRYRVHAPAFASFDGVTGGMILDLSEEGMSMQTAMPLMPFRRMKLHLNLPEPVENLETTGYVAWADAFGRAGVRFSDLPEEPRRRLKQWLSNNHAAPSRKAPKLNLGTGAPATAVGAGPMAISLEPEAVTSPDGGAAVSTTAQYEFNALGPDLDAGLRLITERARSLTRGSGAAVALANNDEMLCRATAGASAPPVGARIRLDSGFTGECIRSGRVLRCDDAETDPRVDAETCRLLGIRSIIAAPILYERDTLGVLEVFSNQSFAFDEGDNAVVQRLGQTVVLALSQAAALGVC